MYMCILEICALQNHLICRLDTVTKNETGIMQLLNTDEFVIHNSEW